MINLLPAKSNNNSDRILLSSDRMRLDATLLDCLLADRLTFYKTFEYIVALRCVADINPVT